MSNEAAGGRGENGAALRVVKLRKTYVRGGHWNRRAPRVEALRGLDLAIRPGAALALVGSSGSGKSTLARCLAHVEQADTGEIWLGTQNLAVAASSTAAVAWRQIQLIFQEPILSLNPRLTAAEIVAEPLLIAGWGKGSDRSARAVELMKLVGLSPEAAGRMPREFSGGQRRRLAIARALAVEPRVLILDEALSGLDLSTQAQIANLLLDLQAERSLTYLWILHDLSLVSRLAAEVAVMDEGTIVEAASAREFFENPQSRRSRALLDAWRGGRA